jgi:hypothetical protein
VSSTSRRSAARPRGAHVRLLLDDPRDRIRQTVRSTSLGLERGALPAGVGHPRTDASRAVGRRVTPGASSGTQADSLTASEDRWRCSLVRSAHSATNDGIDWAHRAAPTGVAPVRTGSQEPAASAHSMMPALVVTIVAVGIPQILPPDGLKFSLSERNASTFATTGNMLPGVRRTPATKPRDVLIYTDPLDPGRMDRRARRSGVS